MRCVTFIAGLLAVSCGSEEKPKPPSPPTDGIEIVVPGAEPRRALRYTLAANRETPFELAMDIDLETVDSAVLLPTMALSLDLAVVGVDQTGNAKMKLTVVGAGARARTASQAEQPALKVMDRQSALLAGLVVTFTLSPTGNVAGSKIEAVGRDLSGPMQEQVTQLVQISEQLAMALPDKPVGVGAVWKHRRTMKQNQLTLVTTTNVEVTAIDGDRVTFKSTTDMTGADQTIAQGSASAQVTAIRGTGSQSGSFDVGKAIVLGESRATLGFEMIAESQRRPTKLELVTRTAPRTPVSPDKPAAGSASAGSDSNP